MFFGRCSGSVYCVEPVRLCRWCPPPPPSPSRAYCAPRRVVAFSHWMLKIRDVAKARLSCDHEGERSLCDPRLGNWNVLQTKKSYRPLINLCAPLAAAVATPAATTSLPVKWFWFRTDSFAHRTPSPVASPDQPSDASRWLRWRWAGMTTVESTAQRSLRASSRSHLLSLQFALSAHAPPD